MRFLGRLTAGLFWAGTVALALALSFTILGWYADIAEVILREGMLVVIGIGIFAVAWATWAAFFWNPLRPFNRFRSGELVRWADPYLWRDKVDEWGLGPFVVSETIVVVDEKNGRRTYELHITIATIEQETEPRTITRDHCPVFLPASMFIHFVERPQRT